jgi:hypothetical protein
MKQLIFFCFLNLVVFNSYSQEKFPENIHFKLKEKLVYSATINEKKAGYVINLNDSSIVTSLEKKFYGNNLLGQATPYTEIDMLTIKRVGGRGSRALKGMVPGIFLGGIIGAATYTPSEFLDFGVGPNILAGSLLAGISGALIGALIGSKKHKFPINKKQANFEKLKHHSTRN